MNRVPPHWQGHRDRLRNRLLNRGSESLDDYELLEVILFAVIPRKDVKPLAKRLLQHFGSLSAALAAHPSQLQSIEGAGPVVASHFAAMREIATRSARESISMRPIVSSWAALLGYVRAELQHHTREQFRTLFLDRKNQLIADEVLWLGTVDHAPVYPREIARRALELAASAVILVHNHPSGDPTPSSADIDMTRLIVDALDPLDITVHDHLIVGREGVVSFKASGLI
ncbi:MAG: DNA repair protein RadC [Pseudomonadota bacterium]